MAGSGFEGSPAIQRGREHPTIYREYRLPTLTVYERAWHRHPEPRKHHPYWRRQNNVHTKRAWRQRKRSNHKKRGKAWRRWTRK